MIKQDKIRLCARRLFLEYEAIIYTPLAACDNSKEEIQSSFVSILYSYSTNVYKCYSAKYATKHEQNNPVLQNTL